MPRATVKHTEDFTFIHFGDILVVQSKTDELNGHSFKRLAKTGLGIKVPPPAFSPIAESQYTIFKDTTKIQVTMLNSNEIYRFRSYHDIEQTDFLNVDFEFLAFSEGEFRIVEEISCIGPKHILREGRLINKRYWTNRYDILDIYSGEITQIGGVFLCDLFVHNGELLYFMKSSLTIIASLDLSDNVPRVDKSHFLANRTFVAYDLTPGSNCFVFEEDDLVLERKDIIVRVADNIYHANEEFDMKLGSAGALPFSTAFTFDGKLFFYDLNEDKMFPLLEYIGNGFFSFKASEMLKTEPCTTPICTNTVIWNFYHCTMVVVSSEMSRNVAQYFCTKAKQWKTASVTLSGDFYNLFIENDKCGTSPALLGGEEYYPPLFNEYVVVQRRKLEEGCEFIVNGEVITTSMYYDWVKINKTSVWIYSGEEITFIAVDPVEGGVVKVLTKYYGDSITCIVQLNPFDNNGGEAIIIVAMEGIFYYVRYNSDTEDYDTHYLCHMHTSTDVPYFFGPGAICIGKAACIFDENGDKKYYDMPDMECHEFHAVESQIMVRCSRLNNFSTTMDIIYWNDTFTGYMIDQRTINTRDFLCECDMLMLL
ncbi:hypothetical protein PCE1_004752 [Barthelona sp. PCE]